MKMMRQTREIIADDELDAPYIAAEEVNEATHRLKQRISWHRRHLKRNA